MNTARLDRDGDYTRLPRNRKIVLALILTFTFITIILVIVTMIRPVPQYSATGALLQLQAQDAVTFSKRGLSDYDRRPPNASFYEWPVAPTTSLLQTAVQKDETSLRIFAPVQTIKHLRFVHRGDDAEDCDCGESTTTTKKKKTTTPTATDSSTSTSTTSTSTGSSTPTTATAVPDTVDIDEFVAMWIGILGVCLQRAAGTLVCTGSSFNPNFEDIYEQSGLSEEVRSALPTGTKGASVGLLFATLFYGLCLLLFGIAVLPAAFVFTPFGPRRSLDSHHQWVLSLAAIIAAAALFSVLGSTIVMRNDMTKSVKALPAIDSTLLTKLGGAFSQLYAICILGGIILVACMSLVAEDARYPWWHQADRLAEGPPGQALAPPLDFSARRPTNPFGGPAGGGSVNGAQTGVGGFTGATPAMGAMSYMATPAAGAMSYAPTSVY